VLQDTYPAEPAHAFPVSTVILNLFFWVVRAGFGEGLWDVLCCLLYTDGEWLLEGVGDWDRMDVGGTELV
jgi:hypothetical protein